MFQLRDYQAKAIDDLWQWFHRHPDGNPIMDCCVGSGKSLMIAATIQRALNEFPDTRVIVVVPQKELLQQNLHKLKNILPDVDVGIYSASMGKKEQGCAVTYATIGSIYKSAHLMGRVDLILCDECHLINSAETGMWRSFVGDMEKYGNKGIRVVGWTGTPFRNGGIWLTAGDEALFHGIAARVSMTDMLEQGYLAPLVIANTCTKIDTSDARTVAGDYNMADLAMVSDRADIVESACDEIAKLSVDRRRLLVFAVNVKHAGHVCDALNARDVHSKIITGDTPKAEREQILKYYAADKIRCLVSIGVLTTGFDQPDIDFIALLRATKSPTLAIQMCGRGMRTAEGKIDCAFADFTDTIERLGAIDLIKGRNPKTKSEDQGAPFKLCPNCGSRNPASAKECVDCGFVFPEPEKIKHTNKVSDAPVLSSQIKTKIKEYEVTEVEYKIHKKAGSPDSLKVEYFSGFNRVGTDFVCIEHTGWAGSKAKSWWKKRCSTIPATAGEALSGAGDLMKPTAIMVNESGKYPQIIGYQF